MKFIRFKQIVRDDKDRITHTLINYINVNHIRRVVLTGGTLDKEGTVFLAEVEFSSNRIQNKKEEIIDDYIEVGITEEKLNELTKL